jgi:Bacterial protein of unknown function (DUF839)
MRSSRLRKRAPLVGAAALAAGLAAGLVATSPASSAATGAPPYATALGSAYEVTPLLSVGDTVPEAGNPALDYQMVGIPDGLGSKPNSDGTTTVFMNHEFNSDVLSDATIGGPQDRGSFVSKWILDDDGDVITGERAYDWVYTEDHLVGTAAQSNNSTPGIARLCSGSLAGPEQGFDRYIYLAGEESEGPTTFDGKGGVSFAFFDNEAHALPDLGRFSKENVLVQRTSGKRTVVMVMEDGPSTPDSQLYMYVGRKVRNGSASVLERNGLVDGTLYTFVSNDPSATSEATFDDGTLSGHWEAIPNAGSLTDVETEAAADALGAFEFIRIEDGAFSTTQARDFFFVTTGGNAPAGNELGRLYHLELAKGNPTEDAELSVAYNADSVIASGGDVAISPDNLDVGEEYLMIQEDGTTQSRAVMADKGRDGSIWRFPLTEGSDPVVVGARERIVELDPPGRDGVSVGPGVWETSGIIDASAVYGDDTWLFDAQAHTPTSPPDPASQVEDGQLLLLTPGE